MSTQKAKTNTKAPLETRPGRRERRRAETRQRLLQCALRLFASRGFPSTTVEDITEAADVGKGTFFNYFPTKEHIIEALAEFQMGKYLDALSLAQSGKLTPRQALFRLYKQLPQEPAQTRGLVRTLFSVFLSSDTVRATVTSNLAKAREMLAQLFVMAQQRGEVDRNRERLDLALAFQQSLLGSVFVWTLHPPTPLDPWLEKSFAQFWYGVAAKKAGGRP